MRHRQLERRWWHSPSFVNLSSMLMVVMPFVFSIALVILIAIIFSIFDDYVPDWYRDWIAEDGNPRLVATILTFAALYILTGPFYRAWFYLDDRISMFLTSKRAEPFYEFERRILGNNNRERPLTTGESDTLFTFVNNEPGPGERAEEESEESVVWDDLDTEWRRSVSRSYRRVGLPFGYPLRVAFLPKVDNFFGRTSFSEAVSSRIWIYGFFVAAFASAIAGVVFVLENLGIGDGKFFADPAVRNTLIAIVLVFTIHLTASFLAIFQIRLRVNRWRVSKKAEYRSELLRLAQEMIENRKISDIRIADGLENYLYRSEYY